MTIRQLSEKTINKIAAGEVVERPASIVKELVENALDAGATQIDLRIENGGITSLDVQDNGKGMSAAELPLAVKRHYTSKLADDDLNSIAMLGFRGEALPAIGAVSRLVLRSAVAGAPLGHEIIVDAGAASPAKPIAKQEGTRILVSDLFRATPARLKFLRSERSETAAIVDILNRLALANPGAGFKLAVNGRARLEYAAQTEEGGLTERIRQIFGDEFVDNSIKIDSQHNELKLFGRAGLPTYGRSNRLQQFLFVNGRALQDRLLISALRAGYMDVMAAGKHPVAALFLQIAPHMVDVNVHPNKAEVRFRDIRAVRSFIIGMLRKSLAEAGGQTALANSGRALARLSPGGNSRFGDHSPKAPTMPHSQNLFSRKDQGGTAYTTKIEEMPDGEPGGLSHYSSMMGLEEKQPHPWQQDIPSDRPLGTALAQIHENYILAAHEQGLIIVDQHAAHERIVYEQLKAGWDKKHPECQVLLIPEIVKLAEESLSLLTEKIEELKEVGLVIEEFGNDAVLVRQLPAILGKGDISALVRAIADEIVQWDTATALRDRIDQVLAKMACYGSVRSGRRLNREEMDAILRQIEATPSSAQCNHGRPTYITLHKSDLERLFARK